MARPGPATLAKRRREAAKREKSQMALRNALRGDKRIFFVTQKNPKIEKPCDICGGVE